MSDALTVSGMARLEVPLRPPCCTVAKGTEPIFLEARPRTSRYVSCCPAKEEVGESSAVALDRTRLERRDPSLELGRALFAADFATHLAMAKHALQGVDGTATTSK
jgi:hypothetical protein